MDTVLSLCDSTGPGTRIYSIRLATANAAPPTTSSVRHKYIVYIPGDMGSEALGLSLIVHVWKIGSTSVTKTSKPEYHQGIGLGIMASEWSHLSQPLPTLLDPIPEP